MTPSSSGLQLDTFDHEAIRPVSIQEATLEILVQHNQYARKLFNEWQEATSQLITLSNTVANLVSENQRLRNVSSGNGNSSSATPGNGAPPSGSSKPRTHQGQPPLPIPRRALVKIRSSKRPANLPFEVLWNLEDCNEDNNACPGANNGSRPPMTFALRTESGDLIPDKKFADIRSDVASLCAANLHSLPDIDPSKGRKAAGPWTRSWYACWYKEELMKVIEELERMHPILALCSGHWKVEHLISNHLNSNNTVTKRRNNPTSQPRQRQAAEARKHCGSGNRAGSRSPQRAKSPDLGMNQNNSPKRPRSGSVSGPNDNKRQRTELHNDVADILGTTFLLGGPANEKGKIQDPAPSPESSPRQSLKPLSPRKVHLDIGFICMNPDPSNLKESLSTEFKISHGVELISGLESLQKSDLIQADPSANTLAYLKQLEDADPNVPGLSEEDDNEAWGHYQYWANGLTPMTVLKDWTSIGNVSIVYRLLAASIKTSRVACYLVNVRKRKAQQYTSDAYVDIIVSKLWKIVHPMVAERSKPVAASSGSDEQISEADKGRERLKPLHIPQLKKWAQEHQIPLPAGKSKKQEIIDRILASSNIPTDEEITQLVATR